MRVNTVVATSALVLYQGLLVNAFPFLHSSTASTKRSINKDSRTYASAHELEHRANDLEIQKITYKRQLGLGDLDLGGGLLNGVLQPFSGVLQSLDGTLQCLVLGIESFVWLIEVLQYQHRRHRD